MKLEPLFQPLKVPAMDTDSKLSAFTFTEKVTSYKQEPLSCSASGS